MVPELVARYWGPPEQPDSNPDDPETDQTSGRHMQFVYNA
jgi:hypothetical protein